MGASLFDRASQTVVLLPVLAASCLQFADPPILTDNCAHVELAEAEGTNLVETTPEKTRNIYNRPEGSDPADCGCPFQNDGTCDEPEVVGPKDPRSEVGRNRVALGNRRGRQVRPRLAIDPHSGIPACVLKLYVHPRAVEASRSLRWSVGPYPNHSPDVAEAVQARFTHRRA